MRRRGFTLVETLLAMAVTSLLVMAVFGGLTFVGRGYRRDELAMARVRTARDVYGLLADDLAGLHGVAIPPKRGLSNAGYGGTQDTFISEPRRGSHVVAAFDATSKREGSIRTLAYDERASGGAGGWAYATLACHWLTSGGSKPPPNPWGLTRAVFLVPLPPEDPDVVHVALSVRRGVVDANVLWSFFRKRRGRFEPGTILRTEGEAPARTFATPLIGDVSLANEWVQVTDAKGGHVEPLELYLTLDLREPGDLALPFAEPPYRAHRVLTAGL